MAAKVKASIPARVLDISATGMQIELDTALRPNVTCELKIILEGGDVNLRGTVRRCRAWGFGLGEKDQRVLVYRAGVEFAEIPAECLAQLRSQLLTAEAGGGEAAGTGAAEASASRGEVEGVPFPAEKIEETCGAAPPEAARGRSGPVKIRISAANVKRILDGEKS